MFKANTGHSESVFTPQVTNDKSLDVSRLLLNSAGVN